MTRCRKHYDSPVAIADVLRAQPLLRQALARAETDTLLAQHLHTRIPSTCHCTGFSTDEGRREVVLHVSSAAWGHRLLMEKQPIINEIRKIPGFSTVHLLRLAVSPSTAARGLAAVPRPRRRCLLPPPQAAAALRGAAALAQVASVRQALLRLARRAEDGGSHQRHAGD